MFHRTLAATALVTAGCLGVLIAGPVSPARATYPGADGRIAFGMVDSTGDHIYSVEPSGRAPRQLTSGPYVDLCAAYSPDASHIAFCSNRSGAFQIWTMTANGHHLRRLTDVAFATFPDYSPDGRRIAFDARVGDSTTDEIFVMNTDGTHVRQLTTGADNDWPAWSPDGRRIAFISDRTGIEQVFTMCSDGRAQTQLTFQPITHDQLPDWRPDGRQIAYTQGTTAEKIWVMNADGSAQHQVSHGTTDDFGPAWSPNGRQIAFLRNFGSGHRPVTVMNPDGRHAHAVYDPTSTANQFVPAWQPAGPRS